MVKSCITETDSCIYLFFLSMQTIFQKDILSTINFIFSYLLEKYSSFDKNIIYMLHQKMCKIFSENQKEPIRVCGSAFA